LFILHNPPANLEVRFTPHFSSSGIEIPSDLKVGDDLQGVDILCGSPAGALYQIPDLFDEGEERFSGGFWDCDPAIHGRIPFSLFGCQNL